MVGTMCRIGQVILTSGAVVLIALRDFVATLPRDVEADGKRPHDSDLIGEYNHRRGRFDPETDPYGWYDED